MTTTPDIRTRKIPPSEFQLIAPYAYSDDDGSIVQIPIIHEENESGFTRHYGFVTDMRSGGKWVSAILGDKFGTAYDAAWINHDWRYAYHRKLNLTRKQADKLLKHDLHKLGMSRIKASVAYAGVRIGGRWAFDRNDKIADTDSYHYDEIPAACK